MCFVVAFFQISNTIRVSNSLDYIVGPDCLQRLSADNTSKER